MVNPQAYRSGPTPVAPTDAATMYRPPPPPPHPYPTPGQGVYPGDPMAMMTATNYDMMMRNPYFPYMMPPLPPQQQQSMRTESPVREPSASGDSTASASSEQHQHALSAGPDATGMQGYPPVNMPGYPHMQLYNGVPQPHHSMPPYLSHPHHPHMHMGMMMPQPPQGPPTHPPSSIMPAPSSPADQRDTSTAPPDASRSTAASAAAISTDSVQGLCISF